MAEAALQHDQLTGRTLGDFLVQEKIGEGGFGAVYRAEQRLLKRDAVVKVLRQRHRSDERIIHRFLREAQLASSLDHPYAAHIYAFGAEPDGLLWIAMERVRGTPLDKVLASTGPLPLERFVPLFQRICEVVHSAHERQIVHRDLKPANVMVLSRAGMLLPKLLDFGIAKHLGAEPGEEPRAEAVTPTPLGQPDERATVNRNLTDVGAVIGSPHYMAPEQWLNKGIGPHTDLYALGVMAFELLTGSLPFDGKTAMAIAKAHATGVVPPINARLPAALNGVLARAMAKRPGDRHASALELAAELHAASGLNAQPLGLPQLEEPVREASITRAPQPLAEAVAAMDAVRSVHQARDASWQVFRVAVRLVGLYALAASSRGADVVSEAAGELLRTLRRRCLSEREWIALARGLVEPFAARTHAHPVPELVGVLLDGSAATAGPFLDLAALADEGVAAAREDEVRVHLARVVPLVSSLLRRLSFLHDYPLVAVGPSGAEAWMGVRRAQRAAITLAGPSLELGAVALLGEDGAPLVRLSPLFQIAAPTPGAALELFTFDGPSPRGARLRSLPGAFEHVDDRLWEWFRTSLRSVDGAAAEAAVDAERTPYVGLAAFAATDADLFFGREDDIDIALNRLRAHSFLAVVGPSGAGKSSFVSAGLGAALPAGSLLIDLRPGPCPFQTLAARLARAAPHAHLDVGLLSASPEALAVALATLPVAPAAWTVLFVDQLEELFTLARDEQEVARFAAAIALAARTPEAPVRVVVTLRDDFLMRAQALPPLREALAAGLQLLGTPGPDELRRIIVEPARRVGYELDDAGLPDEIVAAVRDLPAALPLVSFTALRLWEQRDRHFRQLTRKAYAQMGGVAGALALHAEEMLGRLGTEDQRLVRVAFRHLVTAEGTRAVLTRDELAQVLGGGVRAERVIDHLVQSRLVVAGEAEQGVPRVEIAHEALITAWPRLVTWRSEDAEGARLRDQLRAGARQWEERGRPRGLLWRDEALAEYELWRHRHPQPLTSSEEAFGGQSRAQARGAHRLRVGALATVIALLVLGLFALWRSDQRSRRNAAEAKERLALFQVEQGRRHFFEDDPLRALLYLGEAARLGLDTLDLRMLVGIALQALEPQRAVLRGHDGEVRGGGLSRDGKLVMTFSPSGSVRLYDAQHGVERAVLRHPGLRDAALSPDGSRVATRDASVAKVWDAATGRELYKLEGLSPPVDDVLPIAQLAPIARLAFADGGRLLVTPGADHAVHLWGALDGRAVRVLRGHSGTIRSLTVEGARIVTTSADGTARVWDARSGAPLTVARTPAGEAAWFAAISADAARLLTGGPGAARLWDAATGRAGAVLQQRQRPLAGAFTADGAVLAVLVEGQTHVQLWDGEGRPRSTLAVRSAINALAFSPDGARLATAGSDGIVRVWDVGSGTQQLALSGHVGQVWHVCWSADGDRLLSTGVDHTARLWDPSPPGRDLLLRHGSAVMAAIESADGSRVHTSTLDGGVHVWSGRDGARLSQLAPPRAATLGEWLPAADAFVRWGGRRVELVDVRGQAVEAPAFDAVAEVTWAAVSPDRRSVAAGCVDGTVLVWRAADGSRERLLREHDQAIVHVAFDRAGRQLGTTSYDETARVWRLDEPGPARVLRGHVGRVESIDFSPDGRTVLTAGYDQTLRLWEAGSGRQQDQLAGHGAQIMVARFSHDGRLIGSAGADAARVFSVATGKQIFVHALPALGVTFSRDDRRVFIARADGTVDRWALGGAAPTLADLPGRLRCLLPYRLEGETVLPRSRPADCRD